MTETRHYNAFISYRHLEIDSYVAEKLQKLLENYKPPKGVGETDRIQYIFLDRSELPTSKSLDQSLKDALFNSDYLIVILSAAAAGSSSIPVSAVSAANADGVTEAIEALIALGYSSTEARARVR